MATTSKEGSRRVNYPFSSVENKSGASRRGNFSSANPVPAAAIISEPI